MCLVNNSTLNHACIIDELTGQTRLAPSSKVRECTFTVRAGARPGVRRFRRVMPAPERLMKSPAKRLLLQESRTESRVVAMLEACNES